MFRVIFVILFVCSITLNSKGYVHRNNAYESYAVISGKKGLQFRFVGRAPYPDCAEGVKFANDQLLLVDSQHDYRPNYYYKATFTNIDRNNSCEDSDQLIFVKDELIKSDWRVLAPERTINIIAPAWVRIEFKDIDENLKLSSFDREFFSKSK